MAPKESHQVILPSQVTTTGDLNRLIRELDTLDDYLNQAALRSAQEASKLPQTSRVLEELAASHSLQLLRPGDRKAFKAILGEIKQQAPTIHFSFASPPSLTFLNKLVTWLRTNIDTNLLLKIGLEPSIAGGCIVRTTNKQFDFSLRKHFVLQHDLLVNVLTGRKESQ
jgi:F0F1-type ATP synthase delta subunit